MGIEQTADRVYSVIVGLASELAPAIIEIILLVTFFNFIRIMKKMISGIEQNVFLIVQQNARMEKEIKEIKEKMKEKNSEE